MTQSTPLTNEYEPDFATIIREQIDLAVLAILLRQEIDTALQNGDEQAFRDRAPIYRQVTESCLWQL